MTTQITAAAIVSFTGRLQDASATLYRALGEMFPEHRRIFDGYVQRCEKDKVHLLRTYQETVTDALETGFSFAGVVLPEGLLEFAAQEGEDQDRALARAIQLEEGAAAFYEEVATKSEALLATIPRAYRRVAARRAQQEAELRGLRIE